jgi:KDO2-lipid IV(A) lauroyltransferase
MAGRRLRAFRSRAIYRLVAILTAIGRRIPLSLGRFLGRALGTFAFHVVGRQRRKALANIAIAFPEWSDAQRRATIRAMFRHLGMCLFEIAWLPNLTPETRDRYTRFEGVERAMHLIDAGRGVVIFTAHCGNWEWISYTVGLWGRPLSVMQRERDEHGMNRFITELRARSGVRTIDRGSASSARDMIKALRSGGMLAFVIDQSIRTESVKVPFFGKPAPTPIGPARLAVRTGAMGVTGVCERLADGTQVSRFLEPFECTGADPVAITERVTREVEEQIRKTPEQWPWFHDRWKERPSWDVTESSRRGATPREGSGESSRRR